MSFETYVSLMPKAELHVHLEGSVRPETLLTLAKRNDVALPATTLDGLRDWYRFRDFDHFSEVFQAATRSICTADDIELITREFLENQAVHGVRYTEVTTTMSRRHAVLGISFHDQLAAINRARAWAAEALDVHMGVIVDIVRSLDVEAADLVTNFAIESMGDGVVALGLGGTEGGNPPSKFANAYARAPAMKETSHDYD
jgi:aminodeoxyfutalosine deaminase